MKRIVLAAVIVLSALASPRSSAADSAFTDGIYVGQVGMTAILFLQPMANLVDADGNAVEVDASVLAALASSFTVGEIAFDQFSAIAPPVRFEEAHQLLLTAFEPVAERAATCRVALSTGVESTACLDVLMRASKDLNIVQQALMASA